MNHRVVQSPWTNRLLLLVAILLSIIVVQNFRFDNKQSAGSQISPSPSVVQQFSPTQNYLRAESSTQPNYLLLRAPEPLPSVKTTPEEEAKISAKRKKYGGTGDKQHLGMICLAHSTSVYMIQKLRRIH
jgi:hypothetical protein